MCRLRTRCAAVNSVFPMRLARDLQKEMQTYCKSLGARRTRLYTQEESVFGTEFAVAIIDLEPIQRQLVQEIHCNRPSPLRSPRSGPLVLCCWRSASPVIATSALAVAALSRRSPFVAHLRVGEAVSHFGCGSSEPCGRPTNAC